jgi:hypothetical protein
MSLFKLVYDLKWTTKYLGAHEQADTYFLGISTSHQKRVLCCPNPS